MINPAIQAASPVFVKTTNGIFVNANNITKITPNKNQSKANAGDAIISFVDYYVCSGSTKVFKKFTSAPVDNDELKQKLNIEA